MLINRFLLAIDFVVVNFVVDSNRIEERSRLIRPQPVHSFQCVLFSIADSDYYRSLFVDWARDHTAR